MNDVTISGNQQTGAGGAGIGLRTSGGGTATATLVGSIVAGNTAAGKESDVSGTLDPSGSYDLIGDGTGGLSTSAASHNLLGTPANPINPKLGTLASNGGPTQTMALLAGSPAINAGTTISGVTADQRGYGSPTGSRSDLGAYQSDGVPAEAPSLTVTTTADTVNAFDGQTSLREAIAYANTLSGTNNTITFDPAVFGTATAHTITLTGGQLQINNSQGGAVTIRGPGAGALSLNGNGQNRVIYVTAGTAEIDGLTLTGGNAPDAGGAIYGNTGNLIVNDDVIAGNAAPLGGGIAEVSGSLTVNRSTISNNTAGGAGGIYLQDAVATVANSTISGNHASVSGGVRIESDSRNASLSLTNVTISGNITNGDTTTGDLSDALRIVANGFLTTVQLYDVTISGNQQMGTGSGGIGFHTTLGGTATATLVGSIVAGNTAAGKESDVDGALDPSGSYDLIGDGNGGLSAGAASHNLLGTPANPINPLLAPLGSYGGPTQTMALLPGSPAIDTGTTISGVTADQRGIARPQGAAPDIGAFESRGFSITAASGGGQGATSGAAFANPLVATVSQRLRRAGGRRGRHVHLPHQRGERDPHTRLGHPRFRRPRHRRPHRQQQPRRLFRHRHRRRRHQRRGLRPV